MSFPALHPRVFTIATCLFILAIVPLALQWTPGVPDALRPFTRLKLWRAQQFFDQGLKLSETGNAEAAIINLKSALSLVPDFSPARVQLARLLIQRGQIQEGANIITSTGMDPAWFCHDSLLYDVKWDYLLSYCVERASKDTTRSLIWLNSAIMATCNASDECLRRVEDSLGSLNQVDEVLLRSAIQIRKGELSEARSDMLRLDGEKLNEGQVLLAIELLLRLGDDAHAWLMLYRYTDVLPGFDQDLIDYRITLYRKSFDEKRLLDNMLSHKLDATQFGRLAAAVLFANDVQTTLKFVEILKASENKLDVERAASCWVLLMAQGREVEANEFADSYRRLSGKSPPLLSGRALANPGTKTYDNALHVLFIELPLSRELIAEMVVMGMQKAGVSESLQQADSLIGESAQ